MGDAVPEQIGVPCCNGVGIIGIALLDGPEEIAMVGNNSADMRLELVGRVVASLETLSRKPHRFELKVRICLLEEG